MGVIIQLVLEKADELDEVLDFCGPNDTGNNIPFEVTSEMVANAILAADAIGKIALGNK